MAAPTDGRLIAPDEQNSLALAPGAKKNLAPGGEEYRNGLWLTAGQGLLLRFER